MTTATKEFSNCFLNDLPFERQAKNLRKVLEKFFHKSFKKIRISNKFKRSNDKVGVFMEKRKKLKMKQNITEDDEEEIVKLEVMIAEACEEKNRLKIMENFKEMDGRGDGHLQH